MDIDGRIYAKEQQIKLIDNILHSLCVIELNDNGRVYLKKIKEELSTKLHDLKYKKELQNNKEPKPRKRLKLGYTESIENPW